MTMIENIFEHLPLGSEVTVWTTGGTGDGDSFSGTILRNEGGLLFLNSLPRARYEITIPHGQIVAVQRINPSEED